MSTCGVRPDVTGRHVRRSTDLLGVSRTAWSGRAGGAAFFGVHAPICAREERARVGAAGLAHRHTNTHPDVEGEVADGNRLGDGGAQTIGQGLDALRRRTL